MIPYGYVERNGKPILASVALVGVATILIHVWHPNWRLFSNEDDRGKKSSSNGKVFDEKTKKKQEQTVSLDGNVSGDDAGNKPNDDDTGQILFPWEPNYEQKERGKGNRRPKRNSNIDHIFKSLSNTPLASTYMKGGQETTESTCIQQLEVLACMKLANGGLRAPSCPCCV